MNILPVSVIILTLNEETNLGRCLESIAGWADEVVIIDSYSTDKTLDIAKRYRARIYKHTFKNQADQFNWALDNIDIKNEWLFRLDADEWVTPELWKELKEKLSKIPADVTGFYIKRRVYFMGRWIKHGGYYPTWILRLFRKGKARSESREVDEHIILLEGRAKKLKHDFVDENRNDLEWWTQKQNRHSSREVRELLKERPDVGINAKLFGSQPERKRWLKKNIFLRAPIFVRASAFFMYRYVFRLGFLDGKEGLIFHFLLGLWYRFLVDAKLYEQQREKKR